MVERHVVDIHAYEATSGLSVLRDTGSRRPWRPRYSSWRIIGFEIRERIDGNTPETPARKETRGVKYYCRIEYHGRSHYRLDSGRKMHAPKKKRREDKSPIHDGV